MITLRGLKESIMPDDLIVATTRNNMRFLLALKACDHYVLGFNSC